MPQPRKQFGQHWLRSEKALSRIVAAAELSQNRFSQISPQVDPAGSPQLSSNQRGDRVLEIGPGQGVLTRLLLPLAESVAAVEIDRDLCALLSKKLGQTENFLLLQGDFLTLNLPELLAPFPTFQHPNKVVANIPYNITGPILEKLLGTIAHPNPHPFELIVLLVQKEVAQRLYARAGSTAYGALSVRVQYLADCEFICDVPAKAFYPPPKVDSVVVRIRPRAIAPVADNPKQLETLLRLGFSSKRKMLRNNLKTVIDRDQLTHLLEQLNIDPQARAEDLSVAEWIALSNQFPGFNQTSAIAN